MGPPRKISVCRRSDDTILNTRKNGIITPKFVKRMRPDNTTFTRCANYVFKAKPTLNGARSPKSPTWARAPPGARSPKSPTIWKYIYHMRPARFESQIALTELKRAPLHTGWSHKKEGTKKARWDFKNISSQFFLEEIQAQYF